MKQTERKQSAIPGWLAKLEQNMPVWLHRLELRALMYLTANAVREKAPPLGRCQPEEMLIRYQTFTAEVLNRHTEEEWDGLRRRMYRNAYLASRFLAHLPGLHGNESKGRLVFLLYRNIGITLEGNLPGTLRVPRCSFQRVYTPHNCYVMSGMDAGLICGIFGGGSLTFRQRLTEGHKECQAVFTTELDG